MTTPAPQRGSPTRYVMAWLCLLLAFVALPAGFIQMVNALERGGYGTSAMTLSLVWLGAGGGFLGLGVALMIWELSVRHNIKH